ncbi:peptidylprolyl isomerase [Methanoregula sp.]|jgi:peptidylprolyl isomerase|uniref:peptidylprolyl isomerase n=1 Tax=Methanoregula sp. TaxID=2052170 RepID=UPI003C26B628
MSPIRTLCILGLLAAALVFCAGCTQSSPAGTTQTQATTTLPTTEATTVAATQTPVVTTAPASTTAAAPSTTAAITKATPVLSGKKVLLETTMGNITIALDPAMPITAGNFETLVNKGFYDGTIFHRVINGFMIQGGDPTGTGMGGPGYTIPDEPTNETNSPGAIAMANTGQPNSGGSQFFINLVNNGALQPGFDSHYPVFGNVVAGMDIVNAIGNVQTDSNDRPLQNVTIIHAVMV